MTWWKVLTGHLHLAHQVHVLLLVLLRHNDVGPVGLQVPHLTHPKLLNLHTHTHASVLLHSR